MKLRYEWEIFPPSSINLSEESNWLANWTRAMLEMEELQSFIEQILEFSSIESMQCNVAN